MTLSINVKKQLGKLSLQADLQIDQGLTVLLGPSGCGKTTLLNLIAGLMVPDKGEIIFGEKVYYHSETKCHVPVYKRNVGYVFQAPTLFPHLTIKENILYGAGRQAEKELHHLLSLLRIEKLEQRMPVQISGGQAQRVALARALITKPNILLLDEPFSSLDNFVRQKVRVDLMNVLKKYNIPAILVTHDLEEALMLGDKIAVMDEGSILQYGLAKEIFTRPANRKVARFVGMKNIYQGRVKEAVPHKGVLIEGKKFDVEVPYFPVIDGTNVVFGIRPEDVLYLRPERDFSVKENTLKVRIVNIIEEKSLYRLLLRVTSDYYDIEMLLPRHVVDKRGLKAGDFCKVSLQKKALHIIED